ncbi:hypothetical protein QTP86_002714 [Hemibagrus guttatus]|nr:hypothetical protein QTP86_002714 [Hemibagrus guttatus]
MPLGRLPGEVFWACPTGKRPRGRPRTRWRDYVFQLAWERLGVPPEELEEVARKRENTSPIMDPAELRDIIVRQGALIRSHQDQVEALKNQLRSASLAAPRDPPTAHGMIREVFEYPAGGKDISVQLMELRQGSDTAADYAIRFRTLAAQSGWNDASLWAVFRARLKPELQMELTCRAEETTLFQFVATAIRLDNLMRQHQAGPSHLSSVHSRNQPNYSSFREEVPEPMQLGRSSCMATENFWQSRRRWRSGVTGWREHATLFRCSPIIATWSTFVAPSA